MAQPGSGHGTPLGDMISLVDLIREPSLARIYTYVQRTDEATVGEIFDEVEIPKRTAYDYVNKLEDAGFLRSTADTHPVRYTAAEIELTLQADNETRRVTPELIEVIARQESDEDIDVYLGKYGIDGLATALDYAQEYVERSVNHRIMARELDIFPLEASIILQALQDIVDEKD